jgi:hypothetical protein
MKCGVHRAQPKRLFMFLKQRMNHVLFLKRHAALLIPDRGSGRSGGTCYQENI